MGQRPARLGWLWLGGGAASLLALLLWWGQGGEGDPAPAKTAVAAKPVVVAARPTAPTPPPPAEPVSPSPRPEHGPVLAHEVRRDGLAAPEAAGIPPEPAAPPTAAPAEAAPLPVEPAPSLDVVAEEDVEPPADTLPPSDVVPVTGALRSDQRHAPAGTPAAAAAEYEKVPRARGDRAPLGGIAATGAHVDRVSFGTEFDRGECRGLQTGFSVATHDYLHFCFRVVHQRQVEYVLVKWEHADRVERRAWVRIPADHAYRTRAGLSLRNVEPGRWTVRVESGSGTELAVTSFTVGR